MAEFRLPDPGEGIHEAEVLEIHVSVDDEVKDGDMLFTVETDKAVTEIPSPFDGRITEVSVAVGDIATVGDVLVKYESIRGADGAEDEPAESEKPAVEAEEPGEGDRAEKAEKDDRAEKGEEDDRSRREERPRADAARPKPSRPVPASPATRALARKLDVDLHDIEGSGPDGRIEPQDVKSAAERQDEADERRGAGLPDFEQWGPVERVAIRGVRRAVAKSMRKAWDRIPHVSHHDVADITDLDEARRRESEALDEISLTITPFLVKAAVAALREHPRFNASFDEDAEELVLKHYYNVGVAVDTDEGLVVPVIAEADRKPIVEIAQELTEVADRMRSGDRSLEDFAGGTFTITNPGGIGGTGFTPIINHPEVAILGAARATWEPVAMGDDRSIETRLRLPLVLAFDHRVNDGADAARFMRTVVGLLEDVSSLLVEV